jgi:hypothetical protein
VDEDDAKSKSNNIGCSNSNWADGLVNFDDVDLVFA